MWRRGASSQCQQAILPGEMRGNFKYMAEKEGFEPSVGYKTYTPLAGERLQPLGHLSGKVVKQLKFGRKNTRLQGEGKAIV